MKTPPIVSSEEWEAARRQLLVEEKQLTHARDALAAKRRRMPWLAVEPGVFGWPDHACRGCSMVADHVGNLAHLNARDSDRVFRTYFINNRGDEAMGSTWNYLGMTALGRQEAPKNENRRAGLSHVRLFVIGNPIDGVCA
ncbi:DUF899 family protein [Streptomyces sp. Ag109_G2-15]|uniref:DUF899 family protein n=1 Tax=Streptomyces sp. Ag109_G2-15 TaxID=1938850 RepID=UPI000BC6771D|nr:DUF899 family protein [Streptomyces sp. Ag109_G2-15]SOD89261.1 protein of unknown function [Streptomyces sp. Ag109_G2-15]